MNSGAYKALEDGGHVPEKPPSDVNELDVHVIRCSGVQPRRQGKSRVKEWNYFQTLLSAKLSVVLDRVLSLKETSGAASVGKRNT